MMKVCWIRCFFSVADEEYIFLDTAGTGKVTKVSMSRIHGGMRPITVVCSSGC